MRDMFNGFYGISEETIEEVFTSADTVFIFDTNILLTLYRCEEETRDQFFNIWKKVKDQCWFPHHVCLEYQRNRLKSVKTSRDSLSSISKKINSTLTELKKEIFGDAYNQTISRYTKIRDELEKFFSNLENLTKEFKENSIDTRNKKIDFFSNHDVIRDQIDELTIGRIGSAPQNQKKIDDINNQGKSRYKYKIGPGFEDAKDKKTEFYAYGGINYDAEYGDYYVWSQILDYVLENNILNVVYVTNDAKSDFFFKIDGKVRGPNESLITEIKSKGVNEFILQSIDTFLHHANNYLNADIDETIIDELTNAGPLDYRDEYVYLNAAKSNIGNEELSLSNTTSGYSKHFVLTASLSYYKKLLGSYLRDLADIRNVYYNDLTDFEKQKLKNHKKELLQKIDNTNQAIRGIEDFFITDKSAIQIDAGEFIDPTNE